MTIPIKVNDLDLMMTRHILAEVSAARSKFPTNKHLFCALSEEVGELANALIEHEYSDQDMVNIYKEAVQVATLAIRIANEGDASFPYDPKIAHQALPDSMPYADPASEAMEVWDSKFSRILRPLTLQEIKDLYQYLDSVFNHK